MSPRFNRWSPLPCHLSQVGLGVVQQVAVLAVVVDLNTFENKGDDSKLSSPFDSENVELRNAS
jgi:hypothetical protein